MSYAHFTRNSSNTIGILALNQQVDQVLKVPNHRLFIGYLARALAITRLNTDGQCSANLKHCSVQRRLVTKISFLNYSSTVD